MKKWIWIGIIFCLETAHAGVPQQITYQGTLKQLGAAANGSHMMIFRLTDSEGLKQYWSSGPMPVNVVQGLFAAILSPEGVEWQSIAPYIEVNVDGQTLLPREPVTSAAYAQMCGSIAENSVLSGMIAMFRENCPAGWTRFAEMDGNFPLGGSAYGATGGSATHTHALSGPTTQSNGVVFINDQGRGSFRSYWGMSDHTHDVSPVSNLPPYLTVVYCQKL